MYSCGLKHARERLDKKIIAGFNYCCDLVKYMRSGELEATELPSELLELEEWLVTGEQKEIAVSESTLNYLVDSLGYDEEKAGGLVGQIAREAPGLGVDVYAHVAGKCKKLTGINSDKVLIADKGGFRTAILFNKECTPPRHFVMEFEKGLEVSGKKLESSTRIIATYDSCAFDFLLDNEFLGSIKNEVKGINKAVLSGFHLVLESSAGKIRRVGKIIEEWRDINPDIFIHIEFGQFQNRKALKETEKLFPLIDSVGLNSEELVAVTGEEELEKGLSILAERVERVLFHNQYCSALITSLDNPKEARAALQFASICSAYKILNDKVLNFRELENFKISRLSERGIEIAQNLKIADFHCKKAIVVPSLYIESPRSLVGAGDAFALAYTLVM
ncbi:ADP-specific phosphofructokinase [archaeon]|nr:ADP-specific phosphofructokinase [archaeon]